MAVTITAKPLIDAKFAGSSSAAEYTCPASTKAIIDKFTAMNDDSGAVTLTVWIVPSGGSEGNSNKVIKALSIAAGATEDISKLQNQVLKAGDVIRVQASSADKISIRASGREVVTT